jgi:hypothetical protein
MARINSNRALNLRARFGLGGPATAGTVDQSVTDNKGAVKNDGTADAGTGGRPDLTESAVVATGDAVVTAAYIAADVVVAASAAAATALPDLKQTLAASASSATACNASLGRVVVVPILTENTVVTISNLGDGQSITFLITQHNSSAKTLTFSPVPVWAGGTAYVVSTGADAVDVVVVTRIGSVYFGFAAAKALA